MEDITKIIGENIRTYIEQRKMTREQLAEVLELDTAYLGQCESGERQLGLTKTIKIINYFKITANDLITINIEKETTHKAAYLDEINALLNECSDNQLLAVWHCLKSLLPFLKE